MRATLRWVGRTFIALGLTMMLFVVYELWGTSIVTDHHQQVLAQEFDPQLDRAPVKPTTSPSSSTGSTHRTIRPLAPVARIIIPDPAAPSTPSRALVDAIVVQGTTIGDLAYGPGHYVETPLPWELGATAIAGHRTGWSEPFRHVDRLHVGDRIVLRTTHGTFNYRVTRTLVVEPKDSWVLNGDPNSTARQKLVLTTCTPAHTSLHRLIIWADLTSSFPVA